MKKKSLPRVSSKRAIKPGISRVAALAVLAVFGFMGPGSALACYTVNLVNFTSENITGIWGAQGCAGVTKGKTEICDSKTLAPGEMKSYDYNWGTTAPTVYAWLNSDVSAAFGYSVDHYWAGRFAAFPLGTPACDSESTAIFSNYELWDESNHVMGYLYDTAHPDLGYIYAGSKCMQAASSSFSNGNDIHLWGGCSNDDPQKNRLWHHDSNSNRIINVADPSYCMHKTNGFTSGNNIHMWKCDSGSDENKTWLYDPKGDGLIRAAKNTDYCIVRAGNSNGDSITLGKCDTNDQNQHWRITTWNNDGG